jgi:Na+-driven multidrug efflux pump
MGVTGAAVATTIGRSTGVIYQLAKLLGGRGRVRYIAVVKLDKEVLQRLLRVSLNGMLQF